MVQLCSTTKTSHHHQTRTCSKAPANSVPHSLLTMVPVVLLVLTCITSCEALFLQPPVIGSLAKSVTAACTAGSCTPTSNDPVACTDASVCSLTCPTREDFPTRENPLKDWQSPTVEPGCERSDSAPTDLPSVANRSNGFLSINSSASSCSLTQSVSTSAGRMAVSLWLGPSQCSGSCPLVTVQGKVSLKLKNNTVCLDTICDTYLPELFNTWTHLILQIGGGSASVVINGTNAGAPNRESVTLSPSSNVDVDVGVESSTALTSGDSYQMADVRVYDDILTDREIEELYTGNFPQAERHSTCRCPPTHPQLKTGDSYTCTDGSNETARLRIEYNSPSVLMTSGSQEYWMGPDSGDIILNISFGTHYQFEGFELRFLSTTPTSVQLQYNGTETASCSSNVCTYNLTALGTSASPEDLKSRILSSLSVTLTDPGKNIIITGLTVSGRCNCNGNAGSCDSSTDPYQCNCNATSNSEGAQCELCKSDSYRPSGSFGCTGTCDCEASNTVNDSQICDVDGGACLCKTNVEGSRCTECKNWTYSLSPTEPLVCQSCQCHPDGSENCSNTTGVCTCKANVKPPYCDMCDDQHYAENIKDGCVPCNCNTSGTNVTMSDKCDNSTGQCSCKKFVQGKQCDECKDEYYSLKTTQPNGCLPCDCHPVGSISQMCNKTTGQCPCLENNLANQSCEPYLNKMEPNFGPLAGGTVVTLSGGLLGNSSQQPTVYVDNVVQNYIRHTQSEIVFRTKTKDSLGSLVVSVSWTNSNNALGIQDMFTYKPNPDLSVNALPQVAMYVSGGCGVFFKGSSFLSVAFPHVTVTNNTNQTVRSTCQHVASDIRCPMPDLSGLGDPLNGDLTFGLELDGIEYYDLGQVTVMNDPVLHNAGDVKFPYQFEEKITLEGSGLLGGCGRDEISVRAGVTGCSVTSLTNSEIECKPPKSPPTSSNKYPIVVRIGNIEKRVGMLVYQEFWETDVFIGIMCGIGGLILLAVVIVIICCCRGKCRRKNVSNRNSQMNLVKRDSKMPGVTPNQYSTLPMERINNGFQDDHISPQTVVREPKDALPPTAQEMDLLTDFLNRLDPSLRDGVKNAIISSSDLKLGRVCTARGNYARIIDGTFNTVTAGQQTEKKVTIKTLKEPLPGEKAPLPKWANAAIRECLRLYRYTDNNVLSLIGLALDKQKFHMVYPYMQNRTLKDHIIDTNKEFSVRQLVEFGVQVAEGLSYLASKDITHRDIAARNCMVDAQLEVKICDAAFSWDFYENEYMYDSERERYLPVRWMAPESLLDGFYDMRSDVWSLGVLLWELLTRGCLPFHEVQDHQVKAYVLEGYILGQPQNCSDKLYGLMQQCWDPENEHRPHISSVISGLTDELSGDGVDQEDIYVNLDTVEGLYENQMALGKSRRRAPPPPKTSMI